MGRCSIIIWLISISLFSSAQSKTNCKEPYMLLRMLQKHHYQPVAMNDSSSNEIFNSFIELLDPNRTFLTKSEFDQLDAYRFRIDDEITSRSCTFINKSIELYRHSLVRADTMISEILKKPLDYSIHDTMFFTRENKNDIAKDEAELKKRWEKWLRYEMLYYLFSPENENDKPFDKATTAVLAREAEVRGKVKMKEHRIILRTLDEPMGFDNYVAYMFCNVLAMRFDPHTFFFTPSDKEDFESELAPQTLSFGLSLEESFNGEVQIAHLVPGGPAWRSNELHEGDILVRLKWHGGNQVDLTLTDIYEVEEMLSSSAHSEMELTVKRKNDLVSTVKLAKEKLQADDNIIKSYVLEGKTRVGYISLPGFYTEWEFETGLGCANDVAKEIIKLRNENVSGIILDLCNNGGGSMQEALELAGIFIDEGPLCLLRGRDGKAQTMKDMNRGTVYEGPMVVMVNGLSASASELLSASLQDYHRAVIVGSPTFGKATAQTLMPLDTTVNPDFALSSSESSVGYVNLTRNKFYRITGASHQSAGVAPDVILPDFYQSMDYHESAMPYALASDSVVKKVYYTPYSNLPLNDLAEKSKIRTESDPVFSKIKSVSDSILFVMQKGKEVPLNIELYKKRAKKETQEGESLEDLLARNSTEFKAVNNLYDAEMMKIDEYRKKINEELLKNIQQDIYIEEAFRILNDLIELTKK